MQPIKITLTLYPFGLGVTVAAIAFLLWGTLQARKRGLKPETMSWFALLAIPMCFVCARLCYVLCEFEYFMSDGIGFFFRQLVDVTSGGLMLPGFLGGAVLAGWLACRITGDPAGALADELAAPGAMMLALIHLSEGLAGTGYGWGLEDWFMEGEGYSIFSLESNAFFCRFPFAVMDYYEEWKWAVFVLMALVMAVICLLTLRAKTKRNGGRYMLFLLMLGAALIVGESMRQDSIVKWGFVRVNQLAGIALIVLVLVLNWRRARRPVSSLLKTLGGCFLCALVVIAMEFAMEGKISAIEWLPMDMCYVLTSLACVGLVLVNRPLWQAAWGAGKEHAA